MGKKDPSTTDHSGPAMDIKKRKKSEHRSDKKHIKDKKNKRQKVEEVDAVQAELAAKNKPGSSHGSHAAQDGPRAASNLEDGAHNLDANGSQASEQQGACKRRSSISLVPAETTKYLTEVVEHYKSLVDDEERSLLASNVFEELAGKEQQVAGDPTCSRHLEVLLAAASTAQLLKFMAAIMDSGGLSHLAPSPFGSHVAEKILVKLEQGQDQMQQEEYEQFCGVLQSITEELCNDLWPFITDRYATHVARRVLCVLCGSNVLSSGTKGPTDANKASNVQEEEHEKQPTRKSKSQQDKSAAADGLAAKVAGKAAEQGVLACRFPKELEALLKILTREDFGGQAMAELVANRYSSPFLQAALRAAVTLPHNRNALSALVPAIMGATFFVEGSQKQGKLLEGVPVDHVKTMSEDVTGSRVLEAVAQVSVHVPGLIDELLNRFFAGRLQAAAQHPAANFVVQALLAACSTPEQVTILYQELSPVLKDLLRSRRGGVVAALVAACGRAGCCHKEMCAALSAALTSHAPWAGQPASKVLAAALLSLDNTGPALSMSGGSPAMPDVAALCSGGKGNASMPKLSTLGGAILISILQYPQGACRDFTDSLLALPQSDMARVGRDPAGARALEAILGGSAPAKVKQKLLESMQGSWAVIATSGSGSFLVEKCYNQAELEVKEHIVSELSAAERHLGNLFWGPKLMSRVGVQAYNRDPTQWRQSAASSSRTMAQFAELFNDGTGSSKRSEAKHEGTEHKQQGNDVHASGQGNEKRKKSKGGRKSEMQEVNEVQHDDAAHNQQGNTHAGDAGYGIQQAEADTHDVAAPATQGKKKKRQRKDKDVDAQHVHGDGADAVGQDQQQESKDQEQTARKKKRSKQAADSKETDELFKAVK